MSNIIDKIQLSGITYDIGGQGGSGVSVVEVTEAEYDALPSSAKTDTSKMYVITDAQAGDLTNYYTKTETNTLLGAKADTATTYTKTETNTLLGAKADTATTYTKTEVDNAITAATSTKQDTLVSGTNIKTINNTSLLGSGNIDIQGGGGGKAIEAGRGIAITTGETADTVSFNLPISANTNNSVVMGGKIVNSFTNNGKDCLMVGSDLTTNNGSDCCLVVGYRNSVNGDGSAVIGWNSKSIGDSAFAFGTEVTANTSYTFATGQYSIAKNYYEASFGHYNASNTGSTTADKTLFSVGNGTADNARHNAFEIRQNGDIYITSGNTDIKLQDHLGGGGGGKAIEAGRGISVTTGETADTVSFNLPISAGTGVDSITEGDRTTASGDYSHTEGGYSTANGNYSHAEGMATITYGMSSHAEGYVTEARNKYEHASGAYNVSSSATTEFGHSGNTLFSVGNGTSSSAKHNAFEIRQNGDIYITKDGQDVKLQDQLGGGGGGSSYTAGDGIDITNNVISVTGKVDTNTYTAYTATTDAALASKQTTLTAGTGISIVDNVISATGGGSITIDPSLDSGSTNAVANSAITTAINAKADKSTAGGGLGVSSTNNHEIVQLSNQNGTSITGYWNEIGFGRINNRPIVKQGTSSYENFSLVETSAITTSVSSSSTDAQVPSAKAVNDKLGGLSLVKLTQAEYDALATKDSNTLYVING